MDYKYKYLKYRDKYLNLKNKLNNNNNNNILVGGANYQWFFKTESGDIVYDKRTNQIIDNAYQTYTTNNTKNIIRVYYELKQGVAQGQYIQHVINFTDMTIRDLNSGKIYKLEQKPIYSPIPI